jgi:hypothetical protein
MSVQPVDVRPQWLLMYGLTASRYTAATVLTCWRSAGVHCCLPAWRTCGLACAVQRYRCIVTSTSRVRCYTASICIACTLHCSTPRYMRTFAPSRQRHALPILCYGLFPIAAFAEVHPATPQNAAPAAATTYTTPPLPFVIPVRWPLPPACASPHVRRS